MKQKKFFIFATVVGLTVVGAYLRWRLAVASGLWRDEALGIHIASLPSWGATLDFLRFHESHPPLFYLLMRVWMLTVGAQEVRLVLLPVAIGAALIPVTFIAGKKLFSSRAGLIASGLTTFSPALVEYSSLVRPYSLLPLLALVASVTLIKAIETGRTRYWLTLAAGLLAILTTHNWGHLLAVGFVCAVFLSTSVFPRNRRTIFKEGLIVGALIMLCYAPWMSTLLFQAQHAGYAGLEITGVSKFIKALAFTVYLLATSTFVGSVDTDHLPIVVGSILAALALTGVALLAKAYRPSNPSSGHNAIRTTDSFRLAVRVFWVTTVVSLTVALVFSNRSNLLLQRCTVMIAPLVFLATSGLLDRWLGLRGTNDRRWLLVAAVGLVAFGNNIAATKSSLSRPRSNARELAAKVQRHTGRDDFVIISPVWLASSFNYYYDSPAEQFNFPVAGRQGAVDFTDVRERVADPAAFERVKRKIESAARDGRRLWLISEIDYLSVVTPADSIHAVTSNDFSPIAALRTSQIRRVIESNFGAPRLELTTPGLRPRFENMVAFLYQRESQ